MAVAGLGREAVATKKATVTVMVGVLLCVVY
jgi:hypothetical protein